MVGALFYNAQVANVQIENTQVEGKKRGQSMFWGEHDWRVQIRGVWGKSWTSLPFAEAAKMARWSHAICLYVTYHVVPTPSYDATRHRAILAASALSVLSIKKNDVFCAFRIR
ncbi:MAG TPA: hypothetical protein DHW02_04490 [Ktedonobacter sp.]|nr:hypothetical protein [Ktedonobacter sp.]